MKLQLFFLAVAVVACGSAVDSDADRSNDGENASSSSSGSAAETTRSPDQNASSSSSSSSSSGQPAPSCDVAAGCYRIVKSGVSSEGSGPLLEERCTQTGDSSTTTRLLDDVTDLTALAMLTCGAAELEEATCTTTQRCDGAGAGNQVEATSVAVASAGTITATLSESYDQFAGGDGGASFSSCTMHVVATKVDDAECTH
jgi:hypothetical protein